MKYAAKCGRGCGTVSFLKKSPIELAPLVDRSYIAYRNDGRIGSPNPTNAVGGLFILSLGRCWPARLPPKSHQRSWWIVHTLPTETAGQAKLGYDNSTAAEITYTLAFPLEQ